MSLRSVCHPAAVFSAALVLLSAQQLSAQPGDWMRVQAIAPGADVRIDVAGRGQIQGNLQNVTPDSIVLNVNGPQTIARQDIARVSVKKPGHRKRNALIGLAVGAGVGLGIGAANRCQQFCVVSNGAVTGVAAAGGAAAGAIVGAVIPTGGWRTVYKR